MSPGLVLELKKHRLKTPASDLDLVFCGPDGNSPSSVLTGTGHLIKEVNTEQAIKLDMALGFVEQSGSL